MSVEDDGSLAELKEEEAERKECRLENLEKVAAVARHFVPHPKTIQWERREKNGTFPGRSGL